MLDNIKKKADVYEKDEILHVEVKEPLTSEEHEYIEQLAKTKKMGFRIARSKSIMTLEEIEKMEEVRRVIERQYLIPESAPVPMSEKLQRRMQSEQDTNNAIRNMSPEQQQMIDDFFQSKNR